MSSQCKITGVMRTSLHHERLGRSTFCEDRFLSLWKQDDSYRAELSVCCQSPLCRWRINSANLDSFGIHLVILVKSGPIKARIALLVDQQVRVVDLFELEFYWPSKFFCHPCCCLCTCSVGDECAVASVLILLTQLHCICKIWGAELHHYRIRITIYDFCVVLETVCFVEKGLYFNFCGFNHLSTVRGDT
jgi:hypothetical protein